jgi:hypothetical protein
VSPPPSAPRGSWLNAAAVTGMFSDDQRARATVGNAESRQCYRRRGLPGLTAQQGRVDFRQSAGPLAQGTRLMTKRSP